MSAWTGGSSTRTVGPQLGKQRPPLSIRPGTDDREFMITFPTAAKEKWETAWKIVWDIENGKYQVTVSIGFQDKTYSKQRVFVEGKPLFDSVETNPTEPYKQASIVVDITDGNITMEAGQQDEYTMLNWLSIEPQ